MSTSNLAQIMSAEQNQVAFNEALTHLQSGQIEESLRLLTELSRNCPDNPHVHFLLGLSYSMAGKKALAVESYERVLGLEPTFVEALVNLSADLYSLKSYVRAISTAKRALDINADSPQAWLNLGNSLQALGNYKEALNAYQKALSLNANYAEAWNNSAEVYMLLGKLQEALASALKAIEIAPGYSDAYNNLGLIYVELHCHDQALNAYQRSLETNPANANATNNLGVLYARMDLEAEARHAYQRAIELNGSNPNPYKNLGNLNYSLKRYDAAVQMYRVALALDPEQNCLLGTLLHTQMKVCDWSTYESILNELKGSLAEGKMVVAPFVAISLPLTLAQQKLCAEATIRAEFAVREPIKSHPNASHQKIKIAYLSADFHNHPVAYLIAELFELHDRSRFEVIGVSYGRAPEDDMRRRIASAVDHFVEVPDRSDREIAELVCDYEIDIAIDLGGHTEGGRLGILAYRPAPLQVHYLGYSGTTGAGFVDYLVADSVVIPREDRSFYTEKIASLPEAFQVNDRCRQIANVEDRRTDHGLPAEGFVFCSFNNNWKITPDLFDVWMRILERVNRSVLWLFKDNETAETNLRQEAEKRGVDPSRLVFATKLPLDEHLARHRHADLFLDTFYYNAHTTASDALWTELPVLTKIGQTFASRAASSLLNAIGLPELITETDDKYECLAVELATNPAKLNQIKQKLSANRLSQPLFDTPRYVKHLESAYEEMFLRQHQGLHPEHIEVLPS